METDGFTGLCLGVIALCQVVLVWRNYTVVSSRQASKEADEQTLKVEIVGITRPFPDTHHRDWDAISVTDQPFVRFSVSVIR